MPDEATSLHLRNAHELLLLIPIKHGFVEGAERRTSYASRLRMLLTMLYRPSRGTIEKSLMPTATFSDKLQNIYHFNYGVVDRLQQSELILSATFDSSWESYFHNLVDNMGPLLDAVFCHCQGFRGRSCRDGYEPFADFIREHQVQTSIMYSATPDLTVDDLRILRNVTRGHNPSKPIAKLTDEVKQDQLAWTRRYSSAAWQGPTEFTRLRELGIRQLVRSVWEMRELFPNSEMIDTKRSAQQVFDDVAGLLATSFLDKEEFKVAALAGALPMAKRTGSTSAEKAAEWVQTLGLAAKRERKPVLNLGSPGVDIEALSEQVQDYIAKPGDPKDGLLVLLRFPPGRAAELLRWLGECLSERALPYRLNAALTYSGLRRAGLDEASLERFPKEFREGMEQRSGMLGDLGWPNHPEYWHPIGKDGRRFSLSSIDLAVLFHRPVRGTPTLKQLATDALVEILGADGDQCIVFTEELDDGNHFALPHTARRQPEVIFDRLPLSKSGYDNRIAAGDLFLGFRDGRGRIARCADARINRMNPELFQGGTFLVIRRLDQNHKAFNAFARFFTRGDRTRRAVLGIKGKKKRKPAECPLGHLQRANHEQLSVPRIVRNSFSYNTTHAVDHGPPYQERGHMFIAYNASIAEQYEVLQRWINGGNNTGLLSARTDRVAGQQCPHEVRDRAAEPYPVPHATLNWGLYLFAPSKGAFAYLAEVAATREKRGAVTAILRTTLQNAETARMVRRGRKLIARLDTIGDPDIAMLSWKQLIEEPSAFSDAQAVWAAIRDTGRPKATPYGLLIADERGAKEVLGDDGSRFSVLQYRARLAATAGDFYLGFDAPRRGEPHLKLPRTNPHAQGGCPRRYAREAREANERLREGAHRPATRTPASGWSALAYELAQTFFASSERSEWQGEACFDLRDLARHVVGKVSAEHIGLPEAIRSGSDVHLREFLDHFIAITRYSSFPYPEDWLARNALASGRELIASYEYNPNSKSLEQVAKSWGGMASSLLESGLSFEETRNAVVGANIGFVPPALSMLVNILVRWIENGDIEHPLVYGAAAGSSGDASLRAAILRELRSDPTFTSIYRQALEGNGLVKPGTYVIVGAHSAFCDAEARGSSEPERWLFGGDYGETQHGCPMRHAALGVLTGAVLGVAQYLREQLAADRRRVLVRLGPTSFGFEIVRRVLPGRDLPISSRGTTRSHGGAPVRLGEGGSPATPPPPVIRLKGRGATSDAEARCPHSARR